MIDHDLDLDTGQGLMNTFLTHPDEGGPHPLVLLLMDAPGKRPELHDMARRMGTVGYAVMVANLYYRSDRNWTMRWNEPADMKAMARLANTLDYDTLRVDLTAMLAHGADDPAIDASRVGTVGYCMSGRFAFAAAAMFPDQIKATASYYATRLFGEQSPAPFAATHRAEAYFGTAEYDEHISQDVTDAFEAQLRAAGTNVRFEIYPGAGHGFAFPQRPGFDKAAAERHYERLLALFARNLR